MSGVRAVLLDALGTLVRLEPPGPRLRASLLELGGVDVGEEAAERGFRAEIAHYLANHMRGGDLRGLERLRDECAEVMREAIGDERLDLPTVRGAMLAALEFTPYPDAAPALGTLRRRGLRLVVASNWDCSLPRWLERAGLLDLLDGVVSSAEAGEPKPSPAVFHAALEVAGVVPAEALHVGDSPANDIEGARAAGIRAVLVTRGRETPAGVEAVRSLEDVASLI